MITVNKKIILLLSIYVLLVSCAANNQPVNSYAPGLGEIMSLTSMRHAKLALAGQAKNWALAEYELEELQEGFEDAIKFHPTHKNIKDVGKLIAGTMDSSIKSLEKAIKAKNEQQFNETFNQLTAACNACHQITIVRTVFRKEEILNSEDNVVSDKQRPMKIRFP